MKATKTAVKTYALGQGFTLYLSKTRRVFPEKAGWHYTAEVFLDGHDKAVFSESGEFFSVVIFKILNNLTALRTTFLDHERKGFKF